MDLNIPGFDIDSVIGEGAMATVYLATQRSLQRKVALKIMAASLASDTSFCERFLREGRTLARLSHPHIVTIHDIGNVAEQYYMAMEYLPNGTLRERIARGMSADQGLAYIRQIASALGYAHAQGLIHRDVKPANILFRADGTAVLSDFGIAKSLDDRTQFTQAGLAVGTPNYMSPEQARGLPIDGRADLYSLGVVMYEMLVGQLPYAGTDALSTALAHLTQPLPELPIHHGRYQGVLTRLLAKDPKDRFPDAAALVAALDALPADDNDATVVRALPIPGVAPTLPTGLQPASVNIPASAPVPAAEPPRQPAPSLAQPPADAPRKKPLPALLALAIVAALGLGGAGYWWLGGQQPQPANAATPTAQADKPAEPADKPKEPAVKPAEPAAQTAASDSKPEPTADKTPAAPPAANDSKPAEPPAVAQTPVPETPPVKPAGGGNAVAPEVALAATLSSSAAERRRPLLMPGKKTLFQRVLTKPGTQYYNQAGDASGRELPAFTVLYVYERKPVNGHEWLRVGPSSDGRGDGWVPAEQTSDWKQSLVLKFTDRSGREPVMFLRQPSMLEQLLSDPNAARKLLQRAQQDREDNQQVLALEPAGSAVSQERFYLLPIFDFRESMDENGQPVQLLNVASIDPGSQAPKNGDGQPQKTAPSDNFRTGIVLVVDTSVSMQPYIDQIRDVVHTLEANIAKRGDLDAVSFGLVGFRNSTEKTPGLEYVARTLVPLQQGSDPERFLQAASQVRATTVSSHSFNEDAFAGVMQAVEGMDWSGYSGRLILLVSDAGGLRKNDPYGATGMNEAEVRQAALNKQIRIFAMHLRTDAGRKNHASAEQQYRTLTTDPNPRIGDLYVPVPGGDVRRFGEQLSAIGQVFAELVHQVRGSQPAKQPALAAAPSIEDKSAAVGYAMRMDFLGRKNGSQSPQLVSAWTADRDLTNPALPTFQVCVMLSKLQLNDLQQSLKVIVDSGRKTQSSPKDFFQEIASASAYMSRDPAALTKGGNLSQGGVLGEYLEGLPYKSKVLNMTQDLWLSLSVAEQQDFIDELDSKIRLYQTFHNDTGNWVRFGTAKPADALYRVPLSTLP